MEMMDTRSFSEFRVAGLELDILPIYCSETVEYQQGVLVLLAVCLFDGNVSTVSDMRY